MSKELHSLLLLAELQYSICKYREKRFLWFTLNDLSGEDTRDFTTIDGKVVHVSKSFIKVQPSTTSPQSTHSPSNPQLGLLNGISISSLYLDKKAQRVASYCLSISSHSCIFACFYIFSIDLSQIEHKYQIYYSLNKEKWLFNRKKRKEGTDHV